KLNATSRVAASLVQIVSQMVRYKDLAERGALPTRPTLMFDPPGTRDEFLRKLLEKLMPTNAGANWWRSPAIPAKKVTNAIAAYAPDVSPESVLGLGDETAFGSAKTGFIVADAGITSHTSKGLVAWDD